MYRVCYNTYTRSTFTLFRRAPYVAALVFAVGATSAYCANRERGEPKMHWPQMPDPEGWDVAATETGEAPDLVTRYVGDDWQCTESGPVTGIQFWGSWKNGIVGVIDHFYVAIWRDDPVGVEGYIHDNAYSTPIYKWWDEETQDWLNGERWFWGVYPGEFTEELWYESGPQGWYDPHTGDFIPADHIDIYKYSIEIGPHLNRFEQEEGEIYWLVIQAVVDEDLSPPGAEWGWKTSRSPHFQDDGTYYDSTIPVPPGYPHEGWPMPNWLELRDPVTTESLDLAFIITGDDVTAQACCLPAGNCIDVSHPDCVAQGGDPQGPDTTCQETVCEPLKWSQPPTFNPDSPHPDCFWGWDAASWYATTSPELGIMADDWLCDNDRPITGIHWWGSYITPWLRSEEGDRGPRQPTPPDQFHIGIWTDVPAGVDQPFSHPGTMIREWIVDFPEANETLVGCDFEPAHSIEELYPDPCYRYDYAIPEPEWFYQESACSIYWISIAAIYHPPGYPDHLWGWTTRPRSFNDSAVGILAPTDPIPGTDFIDGYPLDLTESWDMAFVLTADEVPQSWHFDNAGVVGWGQTYTPPHWERMDAGPLEADCTIQDLDPANPYYAGSYPLTADYSEYRFYAEIWMANNWADTSEPVTAELRLGDWEDEGVLLASASVRVTNQLVAGGNGGPYLFDFGTIGRLDLQNESLVVKIIYGGVLGNTHVYWNGEYCPSALHAVAPESPGLDTVVCEPQGGGNPSHPSTYWYDVTPGDFGRCDFHVRVCDPNVSDYTSWNITPWPGNTWDFEVHQIGNEWWASWWDTDPDCPNAIYTPHRFEFENARPSTWGYWTTTIGNSSNPHYWFIDFAGHHFSEPDGYGYRVHVPHRRSFPTLQNLTGVWSADSQWGDFDGDGDLDLVIGGETSATTFVTLTYENQNGTLEAFANPELVGLEGFKTGGHLAWGDYDGDGDLDLAAAGMSATGRAAHIYSNDGAGILTLDPAQALTPLSKAALAWGDYDNDGDLDLVTTGHDNTPQEVSILYENQSGTLAPAPETSLTGLRSGSAEWGDWDGDGDLDLLLTGWDGSGSRTIFYENDPVGTLADDGDHGLSGMWSSDAAWGDYDNDGDLDLAIAGEEATGGPRWARIYNNDGAGTFTKVTDLMSIYLSACAWGDYDNDGDLDVAFNGHTGSDHYTRIYENTGTGFTLRSSLHGVFDGSVSWADVDQDGDLDFLMNGYDWDNIYTRLYENSGGCPNRMPFPPTDLDCEVTDGEMRLIWSAAADAETPPAGLYYNLRVGTSPGANDVLSGAYGSPLMGNVGQATEWVLTVPEGDYYWSVQAIDSGLAASSWSPEDVCRVAPPIDSPLPVPVYPCNCRKNRFVSFLANNTSPVAFEVELLDVGPPECYTHSPQDDVGMTWWVTEPVCTTCDGLPDPTAPPCVGESMWRSQLSSNPADGGPFAWPPYGPGDSDVVNIADCEIIPIATYNIRTCASAVAGTCIEPPLTVGTILKPGEKCWADCVGVWDGTRWTGPNGVVNMADVMAAVLYFQAASNKPPKKFVEVDNQGPNMVVNFGDILQIVNGFKGCPYPFSNPGACLPEPGRDGGGAKCDGGDSSASGGAAFVAFGGLAARTGDLRASVDDGYPGSSQATMIVEADRTNLKAGEFVSVDVYMRDAPNVAAYEVALDVSGPEDSGAGTLVLEQLVIDQRRRDFIFNDVEAITATDGFKGRLGAVVLGDAIDAVEGAYLGTFVFQATSEAKGTFSVCLRGGQGTFLRDGLADPIAFERGGSAVITVESFARSRSARPRGR